MDLQNTLQDSRPVASSSTAPDPHTDQRSPRANASRSSAVAHLTQRFEPSQSSNASESRPVEDADVHTTDEIGNGPGNGEQPRRKRARVGTKITRNRKITSCLPCRERKQKVNGKSNAELSHSTSLTARILTLLPASAIALTPSARNV